MGCQAFTVLKFSHFNFEFKWKIRSSDAGILNLVKHIVLNL